MLHTHKPMTDDAVKAMAARNDARRVIAKRVLGDKLVTHPVNHVRRMQRASRGMVEMRINPQLLAYGMVDGYIVRRGEILAVR